MPSASKTWVGGLAPTPWQATQENPPLADTSVAPACARPLSSLPSSGVRAGWPARAARPAARSGAWAAKPGMRAGIQGCPSGWVSARGL